MFLSCVKCGDTVHTDDMILHEGSHYCLFCCDNLRNLELNQCYNIDCEEGLKRIRTETVDLILTDPDYDVDFLEKQKAMLNIRKLSESKIESYKSYKQANYSYSNLARHFYRVLKKNSHCYMFCSDRQIKEWHIAMENVGFKFCQLLVWNTKKPKLDTTMGYKYLEVKEFILYFQKGWKKLNGYKIDRSKFRTILEFPSYKTKENEWYLCPKLFELLKFLIDLSSKEDDLMLDCFAGSGEHLITALKLKRRFIGFEISKEFCDKVNERIKNHKTQSKIERFI